VIVRMLTFIPRCTPSESCWAHSAMSSLADRILIAQSQLEDDITPDEFNLSIQFLLNCAGEVAGSCHGGSTTGVFQFIQDFGYIPYDTCQPYLACSTDSEEGFCPHVDTTCAPETICRTCSPNGTCRAVSTFPNATVAEYGRIQYDTSAIMAEIYARGPVKASVYAKPICNYSGGVLWDAPEYQADKHNHGVSIIGWGYDDEMDRQYWIVRNSWGQYWGEMGFFRLELGKNLLMIESNIAWATPVIFSIFDSKCQGGSDYLKSFTYKDPSKDMALLQRRSSGST
jgi:cathepsin X